MAVEFDTVSSAETLDSVHSSQSVTHTASGSDRYVIVCLSFRSNGTNPTNMAISYNGTAMSELVNSIHGISGCYIFGLANPTTDAGVTVAASWTNDQRSTIIGVMTFTGVGSTGNTDTDGTTSGQTTAISLTSIGSDDFAVDGFASSGGSGGDPTVGGDQTRRYVGGNAGMKGGGSTQDGVNGGALEWDNKATDQVSQAGVVLIAVVAGTNFQININDALKEVSAIKINKDDAWKEVASAKVNKDDAWKEIF